MGNNYPRVGGVLPAGVGIGVLGPSCVSRWAPRGLFVLLGKLLRLRVGFRLHRQMELRKVYTLLSLINEMKHGARVRRLTPRFRRVKSEWKKGSQK